MPAEASAGRDVPAAAASPRNRWTASRLAGVAYLVPVANIGAIGYMLLFVAGGADAGPARAAGELFLENPQRAIFWWLAILALCCLALSVGYLAGAASRTPSALGMCLVGLGLALGAWRTLDASIAAVVSLPLCFGVPHAVLAIIGERRRSAQGANPPARRC